MATFKNFSRIALCAAGVALAGSAQAAQYNVTFTNTAPIGGTYVTPAWVGFHDGTFDVFDSGAAASPRLEAVAEDGNTGPLSASFAGSGVDGTVGVAPIAPGDSYTSVFDLSNDGSNDYLSLASMVLPSGDFFIGNGNPLAYSVADLLDGTVSSVTFVLATVYDAGTEVNDFNTSAGNPLLGFGGGQGGPNQGANEGGFVTLASGADFALFANIGSNGITAQDLAALNFDNYTSLATIEVSAVPVPAALPLLASALGGLTAVRRKKKQG